MQGRNDPVQHPGLQGVVKDGMREFPGKMNVIPNRGLHPV